MSKYVLTADWHIKENSLMDRTIGGKYFHDKFNILKSIIEFAIMRYAHLFILGDVFDSPNPSMRERLAFHKLMEIGKSISVTILYGNHDYERHKLNFFDEAKYFARHLNVVKESETEDIFNLFPWSDKYPPKCNGNILLGHKSVKGFMMSELTRCKSGYDLNDACIRKYKHCIFGHFHIPADRGNVHYVGSPYPITFGETDVPKRIMVYDDGEDKLSSTSIGDIHRGPTLDFVNFKIHKREDIFKIMAEYDKDFMESLANYIVRIKYNPYTIKRFDIDEFSRWLTEHCEPYFVDIVPEGGLASQDLKTVREDINESGFTKSLSRYIKLNWSSKKLRLKALKLVEEIENDRTKRIKS